VIFYTTILVEKPQHCWIVLVNNRRTEVTFSDFLKNNPFSPFGGKKMSKIAHFGKKTSILTNFSKSGHRILQIFLIETTFMSISKIAQ
jgi:hypothetical protein